MSEDDPRLTGQAWSHLDENTEWWPVLPVVSVRVRDLRPHTSTASLPRSVPGACTEHPPPPRSSRRAPYHQACTTTSTGPSP